MIICEDSQMQELLESNETFRINFQKLLLAFEERIWTRDVCALFKALCEDLFNAYNIRVKVHVNDGVSGGGKFQIEFLDRPTKKTVDRSTFDVLKWLAKR